jgi:hypothetical protein
MPEDRVFDPEKGQAALGKLMPELEGLVDSQLDHLTVDLQDAAFIALGVADFCTDPQVRRLFELLPEKLFDIEHLNRLPDLGWCAWHAQNEFLTALSTSTKAKVPIDLVERSSERRNRMFRVVDYYLGNDPVDGPEVASIRAGTGYKDTANDLVRLAKLYTLREARIRRDTENYLDTDAADARSDSTEIMRHLNTTGSEAARWADTKLRAWTLLRICYDEVAASGRYIFRHDSRQEKFPSLFASTRSPRAPGPPPPPRNPE